MVDNDQDVEVAKVDDSEESDNNAKMTRLVSKQNLIKDTIAKKSEYSKKSKTRSKATTVSRWRPKRRSNRPEDLQDRINELLRERDVLEGANSDKKKAIALEHLLNCEFDRMQDLTEVIESP